MFSVLLLQGSDLGNSLYNKEFWPTFGARLPLIYVFEAEIVCLA